MKKILYLTLSLLALMLLWGCDLIGIVGSGDTVVNEYTYTDFNSIEASNACEVTITRGDSYSISITIDDNIETYLDIKKSDNVLHIDLESGYFYHDVSFKANIIMPDLAYLELSGASSGEVSGFERSGSFETRLSGASDANLDFISVGKIICDLSGASDLDLSTESAESGLEIDCSGASSIDIEASISASNVNIDCSGASNVDLRNFRANNADVSISGASEVYLNLNGSLKGSVSGASSLRYRGTITSRDLDISGASSVEKY